MLSLDDAIRLPRDVRLDEGALVDAVRGERYAVNDTGALVVRLAGRPLADAATEVAERWGVAPERARADVLGFAWVLNRALLANVERGTRWPAAVALWLALAIRLLPLGVMPPPRVSRYPLDTSTAVIAAVTTTRASARRALTLAVLTALALLQLGVVAGAAQVVLVPSLALGVTIALGLVMHESVHAAVLRGVPAALVTKGLLRTYVLHARVSGRRASLVGIAGPAAPALVGVAGAVAASIAGSPSLAVLACPLGAHALSLTVVGRDGRAACCL